ncbi:MAG: hypothetical protein L3J21_10355 [Devosiaceae bacterium]|nr:hypothetical protein [Devosiaceae bacterium]
MQVKNKFGLSWRFVAFIFLSLLITSVLFILAMFIFSYFTVEEASLAPIGETITGFFLSVLLAIVFALGLLPLLLPASLLAWVVSHRILNERSGPQRRYQIAGAATALAGCAGFAVWLIFFSNLELWPYVLAFMMPSAVGAAMISVWVLYPQARKGAV